QLRMMAESAREYAMFLMDRDRKVTAWSPGAHNVLGFAEEEMLGRTADIIFTDEDRAKDEAQKEADTAARDGSAMDERWHVRKDGKRFWGSGVLTAIKSGQGELRRFVKVMRDETHRKQTEEALQKA